MERLHKVMARAGIASRRRSEDLILRGLVKVDGQVIRELGVKVDPAVHQIEVMGQKIDSREPRSYFLFNKPAGYLTTVADPLGRPTVMDFFKGKKPGLFPVGRLDKESEGLLLLTNDGALAYRLTHPRYKVPKVYKVTVRGRPSIQEIWRLRNGIELEDGLTQPARVRILARQKESTILEVAITEGRKRQVRRMCRAVGYQVTNLKRVALGPLRIGNLKPGEFQSLSTGEISLIKQAVDLL